MKKVNLLFFIAISIFLLSASIEEKPVVDDYTHIYGQRINGFQRAAMELVKKIEAADLKDSSTIISVKLEIQKARNCMKAGDFWFRYLDPLAQKSINGPLPVEWETEVFEKFEKPYKREGAGLTLAAQYLDEPGWNKKVLLSLVNKAISATDVYKADSVTRQLGRYHHFYLCNRLFLLNLAAIYTTGFECPDTTAIIPELRMMLTATVEIYQAFNSSFPVTSLSIEYLELYSRMIAFVNSQQNDYSLFDQYHFIKDYVNPLFALNQQLMRQYNVVSRSYVDYTMNKTVSSIFNKDLYRGQSTKGIFLRVEDPDALKIIDSIGKLFFYDPLLSGNNKRSCASCHNPDKYFSDNVTTSMEFNNKDHLLRNTPSLINVQYNHLIMLDGRHISLQGQAKDVITNLKEMACDEKELIKKVLSCPDYKKALKLLLSYTPEQEEISIAHIVSAITTYFGKYGNAYSPFDDAMNNKSELTATAQRGFNLFMSKAQCATCHFVPQFNGVKPPFVGSEFEVIGVPADTGYNLLSNDKGRYDVNAADETLHAFRTGSLRNIAHTAPYMHNAVFSSLAEVVDFYNEGGGAGKGLSVPNQTLGSDKLRLTDTEKNELISFMQSLDEKLFFESAPVQLPFSKYKELNKRKVGGEY